MASRCDGKLALLLVTQQHSLVVAGASPERYKMAAAGSGSGSGGDSNCDGGGSANLAAKAACQQDERTAAAELTVSQATVTPPATVA